MKKLMIKRFIHNWLIAGLMLCSPVLLAENIAGEIEYARGAVTAQHARLGVRILGKGATIYEEDVISTAVRSFAIVVMKDGTKITVRPDSSLGIEKYIARRGRSDSAILNLFKGGMRAVTGFISKNREDAYKIKTAVATIGIRGTEFDARLCDEECQKENKKIKQKSVDDNEFVIGRIAFMRGKMSATDRHKKTRQMYVGGPLYEGDRLQTGNSSFAVLAFKDNSRVTLKEDSEFEIKKLHYDEKDETSGSALMTLFRGGLRAVSGLIGKQNREAYSMRTPVATIGIRGTGYDIQCEDDCATGEQKVSSGLMEQFFNGLIKPVMAAGKKGMYAHVWSGEIELKNDAGLKLLKVNETAFLTSMKSAPVMLPALPLFMRSTPAPRPDKVEVNPNLFSNNELINAVPGLYVTVYDGHVSMATDQGNRIDLGKGEAAYAGVNAQRVVMPVRLNKMPGFQVNDAYPRPESFNENWETLFNDVTNQDENKDLECIAQ